MLKAVEKARKFDEIQDVTVRMHALNSPRTFTFSAPLNLPATLRYIGRFENDRMNAVVDGNYYHVLGDERGNFLVALSSGGAQEIQARILTGKANVRRLAQVDRFVARTFGSCEDLRRFYRAPTSDEVIRRVRRKYRGLRVVGIVSLWECLTWAIIGQQISIYAAFAVRSRLSKAAGATILWRGEDFEGFPTPRQFLALSSDELREAGFSRPKAQYARDIAEMILADELNEDHLLTLPKSVIRNQLLALRGVGPWTCEYAMMRVFGDADALPLEDIGLRNAVAAEYALKQQATMKQVEEISESWKPFRGHATFYLWQTLLHK